MSDIDIEQPRFRHRLTRDWRYPAAAGFMFAAAGLAIAILWATFSYTDLQAEVRADAASTLCNSRAELGVTSAIGAILVAQSDLLVAAVDETDLAAAAKALGVAGVELRKAIVEREEALTVCAERRAVDG